MDVDCYGGGRSTPDQIANLRLRSFSFFNQKYVHTQYIQLVCMAKNVILVFTNKNLGGNKND